MISVRVWKDLLVTVQAKLMVGGLKQVYNYGKDARELQVPTVQHCTHLKKERLCCALNQGKKRFGPIQQNHKRGERIRLGFFTSITESRSSLFYLQGHHSLRYKYSPVVLKILRQAFLLIALPSELNTVSNFKSARVSAK